MTKSVVENFKDFRALTPIFISGMKRSGTTLLQRLLDGHPQLLVYPTEDDILRNYFVIHDTHPEKKKIKEAMAARDAELVYSVLSNRSKLDLPVRFGLEHKRKPFVASGSSEDEKRGFSGKNYRELFHRCFIEALSSIRGEWAIEEIFSAWTFSYFQVLGVERFSNYKGWVTKSAEADRRVNFLRHSKYFFSARMLEVVRDARACYASLKEKRINNVPDSRKPRIAFGFLFLCNSFRKRRDYLRALKDIAKEAPGNFRFIQYEDLVSGTRNAVTEISRFLGIDFHQILTRPTFTGEPWLANSSFEVNEAWEGRIFTDSLERWRTTLRWHEKIFIGMVRGEEKALFKRYRSIYLSAGGA